MSSGEESAATATGKRPKAASRARSVAAMTVAHPAGRRCRNGNDDDDVCSAVAMYDRWRLQACSYNYEPKARRAVALLASLSVYSSLSPRVGSRIGTFEASSMEPAEGIHSSRYEHTVGRRNYVF